MDARSWSEPFPGPNTETFCRLGEKGKGLVQGLSSRLIGVPEGGKLDSKVKAQVGALPTSC